MFPELSFSIFRGIKQNITSHALQDYLSALDVCSKTTGTTLPLIKFR